ncbi:hypothetical protein PAPHI01_0707 [Pancytospora philotis]|nr:hypothetical protein PAPHI01_0707 [Pancytospora philotis]
MEYCELDSSIAAAVVDCCLYADRLVLSLTDRSLCLYKGRKLQGRREMDELITRVAAAGELIACAAASGRIYMLDHNLEQVQEVGAVALPSALAVASDMLLVGSWSKMLAGVRMPGRIPQSVAAAREQQGGTDCKENENDQHSTSTAKDGGQSLGAPLPECVLEFVKMANSRITALAAAGGRIAVGTERMLKVYDTEFREVLAKPVLSAVTALAFSPNGVFAGLISGKIHFESFASPDDSFLFNAHSELLADKRLFHSITHLVYDDYLYSAGTDGKICKWDTVNKTRSAVVLSSGLSIKKFLPQKAHVYALVEDLARDSGVSMVVCKELN